MSIPAGSAFVQGQDLRYLWVVMTYGVVLFSIVVQGSTIAPLIRRSREFAEPESTVGSNQQHTAK
ncbi:hypothetical protein P3339_00110 [Microbulbifer sp. MLAF003]|nr:hypothetical protein [Microbulbifer sp. MLAF003]WHI51289.1 hypothetical protein P3339_00110 [Microbulbifer sp. MLAF003]